MNEATATQDLTSTWSEGLNEIKESIGDTLNETLEDFSEITKEEHYAKNEEQEEVQPKKFDSLRGEYTSDEEFEKNWHKHPEGSTPFAV